MWLGREISEPMHLCAFAECCLGTYERCLAVSERPVIPASPDEADEDVLPSDPEALVEIVDNLLVEPTLLFDGPTFSQR